MQRSAGDNRNCILQNNLHIKTYRTAHNVCCLVDSEKSSGLNTEMKVANLFSLFPDMKLIKNKYRTSLTDAHLVK